MAALTQTRAGDVKVRVEDYLDDRLQTVADLENVTDLLTKVKEQQELLKQQLVKAKSESETTAKVVFNHTEALRKRAEKFQDEQADIDIRLQSITQSNVSDDAVKLFESRISKLRRLEMAGEYVEMLKEVNNLTSEARKSMQLDTKSAVNAYSRLMTLLGALNGLQPAAEGAAPHLINLIEQETRSLYTELIKSLEATFQTTLERMMWPKKDLKLLNNILQDWNDQAGSLLDLQTPEIQSGTLHTSKSDHGKVVVLLPLQIMTKPLAQRFHYHFYGERPTNRLDKPEYFFSHALDLIETHSPFMTRVLQPLLDDRMKKSSELEAVCSDAVSAFISALLPIVSAKCLSLLPNISNQPQLLSHFIHEMMSFDSTLRDAWAYSPSYGSYADWKGLTWDMLNTHGYFNTWLEVEKEFALTRYKKIRDSVESGIIEYDGFESGRSKPTKGAVRVNDLLETITDRYRGLSSFSQKMKFLMDVQLAIFDDYHSHLYGALQAYLVTSHTAGRLIQGQTEAEAGGLKGLETLTKVFGSAEYLERKMSDWSEDLFFLELWEELQDRAHRKQRGESLGRDLTMEEVAAKTSASIKQNDELNDDEGGALFDETAASYRKLRERSEAEIIRSIETSTRNALRPLTKVQIWSSLSSASSDFTTLSTSSALDSLLSTLSALFEFLAKVIAKSPLRRITRQLCLTIQREINDNVILRNTFSSAGAAQLKRDITAIEDVIDTNTGMPGEASRNMRKLNEALTLLNLPVKASTGRMSKLARVVEDDDEWGFGDDNEENQEANPATDVLDGEDDDINEGTIWGLWEAERAIFASNESARKALADMKLEFLSEGEARELIRGRVEINA